MKEVKGKKKVNEKKVKTVKKTSVSTRNKKTSEVPNHNLIPTVQEMGKCGLDHLEIENFKEEINHLCFTNNNDFEGVMCHDCGGDFTTNHKKPT